MALEQGHFVQRNPISKTMMTDSPTQNYAARLDQLAKEFKRLAEHSERLAIKDTIPSDHHVEWISFDIRAHVLTSKTLYDHLLAYRACVKEAEAACIAAHSAGLLERVHDLAEFIAIRRLNEFGGLLGHDGNLFALLVGGPEFELDGNAQLLFEKQNMGWPIQYSPAAPRGTWSEKLCLKRDGLYLPLPGQCRRYSAACESLRQHLGSSNKSSEISPRAQKAFEQYDYVHRVASDEDLTDDKIYNWLEHAYATKPKGMTEHFGQLPPRANWKRYLRNYRQATGSQKHTVRSGLAQESASVVRIDNL